MARLSNVDALLLLNSVDISLKRKHRLVSIAEEPKQVLCGDYDKEIAAEIGAENAKKLFDNREGDYLGRTEEAHYKAGIKAVTYLDDEYPDSLDVVFEKPLLLYCKGAVELLRSACISVVGTRRPSRYGANVCAEFAGEFAAHDLTVVSGFARGIDSIAHKAAVDLGKPTIAVLANGLDVVYPPENKQLAENVLEAGGLFISEYRLGTKPNAFHFPERNRIISGLSRGVFVPEATEKSGTFITVNLALEQGKQLYVTPSNINSEQGKGSNMLIKSMQGSIVLQPEDILADYGINAKREEVAIQLDLNEQLIVEALRAGELHFEDLLEATGLSVNELNSLLVGMEINDLIDKLGGNYYSLK